MVNNITLDKINKSIDNYEIIENLDIFNLNLDNITFSSDEEEQNNKCIKENKEKKEKEQKEKLIKQIENLENEIKEEMSKLDIENINYELNIMEYEQYSSLIKKILDYFVYFNLPEIVNITILSYEFNLPMLIVWYYYVQNDDENIIKYLTLEIDNHKKNTYNIGYSFNIYSKNHNNDNLFRNSLRINDEIMLKYYLMISTNNDNAVMKLALYYEHIERNFSKAIEYYTLLSDKNDFNAILKIGNMFKSKKEYEHMIIFYLKAIEKNNVEAMYNLAQYYELIDKKYTLALHYYNLALDNGKNESLYNLLKIHKNQKNDIYFEDLVKKYPEFITFECIKLLDETRQFKLLYAMNKNSEQEYYFNELCKSKTLFKLRNKLHYFKNVNNQDTCCMCLEKTSIIMFDCFIHKACYDCLFECKNVCIECKI